MAWIEPQRLPLLASGLAMVVLAILLLAIDFSKRANRAFAGLLALRGLSLCMGGFLGMTATMDRAIIDTVPYVFLAIGPLAVYFASLYPRRRGPLGRPGMGWAVLALVLALEAAYFLWHEGYQTVEPGLGPTAIQTPIAGLALTSFGPLSVVGFAASPILALLALRFARDYTKAPMGAQRTSYFLVATGFLLNGVFDGSRQLVGLVRLLQDDAGFPWLPWGWGVALLPAVGLLPSLAGLALLAAHRFEGGVERRAERRRERLVFVLALLAILTGLSALLLPAGSEFFEHWATLVLLGAWRLTLPLFVTYALLRYALFDIDLKVRSAVAWSFVVVVFASVYFLVSESLESLVSDRYGRLGGLGAAGLLTVAGGPLAAVGRRVAHALMPGVRDPSTAPASVGEDIYRQQFLMLQEDGLLTDKERRSLESLRRKLGLTAAQANRLQRAAVAG